MSQFVDHAVVSICGRIRNVPLLELLVEYMDANKCIEELLKQLEEERRNVRREKLAVARLQREVARSKSEGTMREKLIHELEEERRLRLDSEKRLREVTEESELGRVQMVLLQQHFSRMEETVRSLLQNQGAVDTMDIMKAYKDKLSEEAHKQHDGPEEEPADPQSSDPGSVPSAETDGSQSEEERDKTNNLLERLKALEDQNSTLASENETQREQYERCLDEVANQVVQALLTQKDLREECLKLRTRVFDLEQQNRTMSILFQQRVKPASDLLLQKLHSRIMDLSAADLLLEPERSKGGLLSRNADPPSHEVQPNGKAYLPAKCLSQSSLTAPAPVYPRSSCSSSELSLSSACSEYSSGSYTWNDGRSCGKMASLTWEKRLSLGSSAPSNICAPSEEQLPTRRAKESHILEGLRKLQRRKHRSSSASSRVSKSGEKDCMNSNEGIYSLGIKSSSKGVCKPPYVGRAVALGLGVKRFSYDSDDADDESAHAGRRDNVPCRDSWSSCQTKLSRSISDSLCSWEGLQDNGSEGDVSTGGTDTKRPPAYDSKERPERLMCFISSFLSGGVGGRPSAFSKPTKLHHVQPADPEVPLHSSDLEDPVEPAFVSGDICPSVSHAAEHLDNDAKRPSRDPTKLLMHQCLRRDQGRTQSADGRPRPFSLIKEPRGAFLIRGSPQFAKSEESLLAIFDAEGQPIELSTQTLSTGAGPRNDVPNSKAVVDYTQLVSQERPTRQKGGNGRNYRVLESQEKPLAYQSKQSKANKASNSNEGSAETSVHLTPQKKLIKPLSTRANKGHPIPPISDSTNSKSNSSKIPGRNKPTASPLRVSKGSSTEPGNTVNLSQEKSPSSPPVKLSRYIKPSGGSCVQSPKAVNAKLPSRSDWSKCGTSGSPQLSRRHLEHVDNGTEQPTRDEHCETSKNKLRSPSPPLPPGRTTSLLIRPNYEGSPQAHKMGVAQTSAPTTVRGPPPSYHPPPVPNMQATLPIKGHDSVDFDAGYGTALAPQKLVDKTGQHLPKSPAVTHTPSKGTYKRTPVKHYLSSATSGCPPESENAPKGSKNGPPPYGALRGTSLQGSFVSKRGSVHEHGIQPTHKTSTGLPVSLQDQPPCNIEPQDSKLVTQQAVASPPTSAVMSPNAVEKTSKTRIPMGFKAFLKSPPAHKSSQSVPGKHEKDHINSVSKETVTFNASTQCDSLQHEYSIDSSPKTSITEGKGDVQGRSLEGEAHSAVLLEEGGEVCDIGKRGSQLFSRSISVTTKPHLKPALGMNGAKARSQSFSTNYMEKPNISVPDGPGKIRTQIITNSGERGNSLSRQSSMEVPSVASVESPAHCSRNRLSLYGGLTGSNSHGILPDRTSKSGPKVEWSQSTMKGEVISPQPQKEARSLPITDRNGLKNSRKPAKVTSYPQFQSPSSHAYDPNATLVLADVATSPSKPDVSWVIKAQTGSSNEVPDTEEKKVLSPTACTIEEKVMMGIEENLQKCQEQEKVTAAETKQKTGPSLANWFGLRKSKLPALNAKKTDSPKGKEEKKELKIGSVLGSKQAKSDKKKDKKKNDNQCKDSHEEQNLTETNNKLSSIMDQCNIQMGQIANQIQCTTAYFGKDQFMKEFLGRTAVKGDSLGPSLAAISIPKHTEMRGDMEICTDTATIIMTQKINPRAENEDALDPDPTRQDHMIGSGCQMRTLDSGIGTFPLPDSVTRAGGRHVPKSESSPGRISGVTAGEPGRDVPSLAASPHRHQPQPHLPPATPPDVKVPSLPKSRLPCLPGTLGHSLSDPTMTLSSQSRLPKPATTDVIRSKRLSQSEPRSTNSSSMEAQEKAIERTAKTKDHDLPRDRTLRVCTYPGSSSDSDTEAESSESTLGSPQKTLVHQPKKSNSVDHNEEETLKRSSVEKALSIMDYYQHDMFSHMEKDSRRISQYNLLHNESPLDGKAGDRLSKEIPLEKTSGGNVQPRGSLSISLESLNKLNHGGSGGGSSGSGSGGLYPDTGPGRRGDLGLHGVTRTSADDSCRAEEPPPPSSSPTFSCKPGADPTGSLSDSLYDSFSSCTSQGSNDV